MTPTPGELAAYLDGELSTDAWLRVEGWLTEHPDVAAYLDGHREVAMWFESARPPEPSFEEWDAALQRIENALAAPASLPLVVSRRPKQGRRGQWMRWTAAAAAIIVAAVLIQRQPSPMSNLAVEPLPVASADDVEILSIHGADMAMLLVGAVPLQEPVALATGNDVTVENMQPDSEGLVPSLGISPDDTGSPMIVTPANSRQPAEKAP
jgi:anti-sigma factor RsiW